MNETPSSAADLSVDVTVCILAVRNSDGTQTLRYHGPISDTQAKSIVAFVGPAMAEQLLSAEEIAAFERMPQGAIVATGAEWRP